ncbi:chaplin [Streptomyces sp. NBC_00631]|uniref:chaplin n=1 Tax=Streptomyces sp. NBC_00631 TaxID=2975793 RepID=UPI0030E2507E
MKKTAAVVAGTILALGGAVPAFADADAQGGAIASPGVLSGNVIQVPIHIPINLCGNTVDVIALLNPAAGNTCINGDISKP